MGFQEILELNIPPAKLAIIWFNSYCGILVKTLSSALIFDPVKVSADEYIQADAIVITHEHLDHFDPELVRGWQRKAGAPILTTPFVARSLSNENTTTLRVGDSLTIRDIELRALRCDHPANEPLSFIIKTGSGLTIYHPSDSDPFAEMAEIGREYKPDILVYVGTSTTNAAQIARLTKPQIAVSLYTDAESEKKFIEAIRKEAPATQAKVVKRFEIYQYPD